MSCTGSTRFTLMAAGRNFAPKRIQPGLRAFRYHFKFQREQAIAMFKRIAVAYSESPEGRRALTSAVHLAKTLGAELRAVTILQAPPAYTAYADAVDPSLKLIINSDRMQAYERLHSQAREAALREGVELETHLLEGEEVDAIVHFLTHHKTDLLVVGLHHHQSHISRLWSTVYALAQDAPCSVLGVH